MRREYVRRRGFQGKLGYDMDDMLKEFYRQTQQNQGQAEVDGCQQPAVRYIRFPSSRSMRSPDALRQNGI